MNELSKFKKGILEGYLDAVSVLPHDLVIVDGDEPYILSSGSGERWMVGPYGTLTAGPEPEER